MGDQSETSQKSPSDTESRSRATSSGHVGLFPPLTPGPQTPGKLTLKTATEYARQNSISFSRATPRSARGLSRKLQAALKKQRFADLDEPKLPAKLSTHEQFQARNRKHLSERELKKLSRIQRSRYQAYEPETKEISDKRLESVKRVRLVMAANKEKEPTADEIIENEWDSGLVGHLKAAEARHRLRTMRMGYERDKMCEISHLIASQPSSIEAVRLKCLLQPASKSKPREFLAKHERERCETLLEDQSGQTIDRTI